MFLAAIGGPGQLEHFMTLPAAEAMPQALKDSLGLHTQTDVSPHAPHKARLRVVLVDGD